MKTDRSVESLKLLIPLCPIKHTTQKNMFGCPVIFVRKKMFAGIYRKSLFLKVGERKKQQLILSGKAKPFKAKGREMKEYIVLPMPTDKCDIFLEKLIKAALRQSR